MPLIPIKSLFDKDVRPEKARQKTNFRRLLSLDRLFYGMTNASYITPRKSRSLWAKLLRLACLEELDSQAVSWTSCIAAAAAAAAIWRASAGSRIK